MMRGAIPAILALAASVVAAAPPDSRNPVGPSPPGTQEFRFRGLVFTIPASWSVQRADQRRFRAELVRVTGRPSGPRLTFGDTVQLVKASEVAPMPRVGPNGAGRSRGGMALERYEMPNAAWRGVLYVFPGAGVSVTARIRNEAEARAADAVVQSARRALPAPRPARS